MKSIRTKQPLHTIQLFLLCSAVFWGISVLVALVTGADSPNISYVLVSSLLSSGVIAVLFTTAQRSGIRLRSRKILPDTLGVRPVAEHELHEEYIHVVQQCTDAVKKLRGVRSWNVDAAQGVITASVGMSFLI